MKQFKDLTITGPDEQLVTLMEKVSAKSPDGWRRAGLREQEQVLQDAWQLTEDSLQILLSQGKAQCEGVC